MADTTLKKIRQELESYSLLLRHAEEDGAVLIRHLPDPLRIGLCNLGRDLELEMAGGRK